MRAPGDAEMRALLCVDHDGTAGPLVCAFARGGMLPTLAADAERGLACLRADDHQVVVVALADRATTVRFIRDLRAISGAALVVLTDEPLPPAEVAELGVHAQMPAGSDASLVGAQAAVLLDLAAPAASASTAEWGPMTLDPRTRRATWGGRPVELTRLQFAILQVLVEARGAVVSTSTLCDRIWSGVPLYDAERLFAHVRRIRSKIEPSPDRPVFLLTVRGVGFRLADENEIRDQFRNRSRSWRGLDRRRGDRRGVRATGSA